MRNSIKYYREYYGMSQRELAEKIQVSFGEISLIENGKRLPSILIAMKISRALNIPLEKLFKFSDG